MSIETNQSEARRLNAIGDRVARSIIAAGSKPYQPVRLSARDAELQHRQAQAQRLK